MGDVDLRIDDRDFDALALGHLVGFLEMQFLRRVLRHRQRLGRALAQIKHIVRLRQLDSRIGCNLLQDGVDRTLIGNAEAHDPLAQKRRRVEGLTFEIESARNVEHRRSIGPRRQRDDDFLD